MCHLHYVDRKWNSLRHTIPDWHSVRKMALQPKFSWWEFQYLFRTNAIERYRATVTGDFGNGVLDFDYGDGRVSKMRYLGGDLLNYIVLYNCVSCNDYGDQGSEWLKNIYNHKWIFLIGPLDLARLFLIFHLLQRN